MSSLSISSTNRQTLGALINSLEEQGFSVDKRTANAAKKAAAKRDSVFSNASSASTEEIAAPAAKRVSEFSNQSSEPALSSNENTPTATPAATMRKAPRGASPAISKSDSEITIEKGLKKTNSNNLPNEPAPVKLNKQQRIEIEDAENKKKILMLRMQRFGISLSLIPKGAIALTLGMVTSPLVCAFSEKIKNREATYNKQIAKKRTLLLEFEKELISCSNEERIEFIKKEIERLKIEIKNQRGLAISQAFISALARNSFQGLARTMLKRQFITSSAIPEIKDQINREDSLKGIKAEVCYLPKKVSLSKKFSMFMLNRAVKADKDRMPLTHIKTLEISIRMISGETPFYKSSLSENAKRFIPFSELRQLIKDRRSNNS